MDLVTVCRTQCPQRLRRLTPSFLDLAGRDLTEFLAERGCPFATIAEREIVRDVKEKPCYIALDCDTELKSTAESPDLRANRWKHHHCPAEPFRFAEVLFQPHFIGNGAAESTALLS